MNNKVLSMSAAAIVCSVCMAQNPEPFSFNPDITPSTETFQIQKYGNIAPSLYTGAMSFSIPLYVYQDEDFEIPLTLMYSFDGYRPDVHSGTVGYGWALECGGSVTREVRGYPDETANGEGNSYGYYWTAKDKIPGQKDYIVTSGRIRASYLWEYSFEEAKNVDIYSDQPVYGDSRDLRPSKYDTAADIFRFNFLGITGEFMLSEDGTMEVFNSSIPEGEIDIEYDFVKADKYVTPEFTIKTGNGYEYIFGGTFSTVEYSVFADDDVITTPSAFKLRKITAPNGNVAEFQYGNHLKESRQMFSYGAYQSLLPYDREATGRFAPALQRKTAISVFAAAIESINVNGKRMIGFAYVDNGHDEDAPSCYNWPNGYISQYFQFAQPKPMDLRQVKMWNWAGDEVGNVKLEKQFIGSGVTRMFLTSVASSISGKYSFSYDNRMDPPANDTYDTDYWGFWNNRHNSGDGMDKLNADGIEKGLYNQFPPSYSGKEPDFRYSKFGSLNMITYPTGGYSTISYEQHSVSSRIDKSTGRVPSFEWLSNDMSVGGVRVRMISNESDGVSDYVEYSYSSFSHPSKSSGVLMYMPLYVMSIDYSIRTEGNQPVLLSSTGCTDECDSYRRNDPHIAYPNVRETFSNGSYNEYVFDDHQDWFSSDMYHYESIEKAYDNKDVITPPDEAGYLDRYKMLILPSYADYSMVRGKLIEKQTYASSGHLVLREGYGYDISLGCMRKAYFNTLLDYTGMERKWYISRQSSHSILRYDSTDSSSFLSNYSVYIYNDKGQISAEYVASDNSDMKFWSRYRYCHETMPDCPQWLKSAVSDIAKTTDTGDGTYLLSLTQIRYDAASGNPAPSTVTTCSSSSSELLQDGADIFAVHEGYSQRADLFSYDDKYRLVMAESPGGAYVRYYWDNAHRHILKKESNSPGNTWEYEWKDLSGPTKITYPTTGFNMFGYDKNNRLSEQLDLNGNLMYRYLYHLENE